MQTTPKHIPSWAKHVLDQYADALGASVTDTSLACVRMSVTEAIRLDPNLLQSKERSCIRVNMDLMLAATTPGTFRWDIQLVFAAKTLPMPPDPNRLRPYLPEKAPRSRAASAIGPTRFDLVLSKRQTAQLRHLSQAWSMTVPEVAKVLLASHPCMHLPATVSPPRVFEAARAAAAQEPAEDQEVVVITG